MNQYARKSNIVDAYQWTPKAKFDDYPSWFKDAIGNGGIVPYLQGKPDESIIVRQSDGYKLAHESRISGEWPFVCRDNHNGLFLYESEMFNDCYIKIEVK